MPVGLPTTPTDLLVSGARTDRAVDLAKPGGAQVARTDDPQSLEGAAKDLESVFLYQLLSTMRKTVPEGGFIERSNAEQIYREMFDQAVADVASERGTLGIAERLVEQLGSPTEPPEPDTSTQGVTTVEAEIAAKRSIP